MNIDLLRLKVLDIVKIKAPRVLTMREWLREHAVTVKETKTGYTISINDDMPNYISHFERGNQ